MEKHEKFNGIPQKAFVQNKIQKMLCIKQRMKQTFSKGTINLLNIIKTKMQ